MTTFVHAMRDSIYRLPRIVRLILRSSAAGVGLGLLMVVGLVATDAAGLWTLIAGTSDPVAPLFLLGLGFSTLFGSLYAGAAIMRLPYDEER